VTKIGIIVGSTRPGRVGDQVGRWVHDLAIKRGDVDYELIDLADHPELRYLDEPVPPAMGQYMNQHTKDWAAKIAQFDGFVIVTAEYNHSVPGGLKTALDFIFAEWNDKAVGFVSYGAAGGVRAAEHLRLIAAELKMASVRTQVILSMNTDFESWSTFAPAQAHEATLDTLLTELVTWSRALETVRN
jgi:NAD(P)H-dependent FMN reductase